MIAVIFEVEPREGKRQACQDIAADLRPSLDEIDGFLSIERFESLTRPGKIQSLSFFREENAIAAWRSLDKHRDAQCAGRRGIFDTYRLRVASIIRDYGMLDRTDAPEDSRDVHDEIIGRI
jgi:heme-degrading monooxygenase HmoA